jgi:hypothetical protein
MYITPAGEFVWPWLNKADDRPINGKPQKPAWKLEIKYPANAPAWLNLKGKLDALVEESYTKAIEENPKKISEDAYDEMSPAEQKKVKAAKTGVITRNYPYKMETDEDGEETGSVTLKLKQNASFKDKKTGEEKNVYVDLFDATLTPINRNKVMIFGGSTGTASFTTRPYFVDSTNGAGISLDLKAVQVLQLVTAGARSASSYGFEKQDGYEGVEADETEEQDEEGNDDQAADETDPTDF